MNHIAPFVLLIEDHEASRELYEFGLRHAGFAVKALATPAEALQANPPRPVDVVVLDFSMPKMSGAELAARLKQQSATAHARYLLVTGHGPDALRAAASVTHFDAMVKKPVAADHLVRMVRRLLPDAT